MQVMDCLGQFRQHVRRRTAVTERRGGIEEGKAYTPNALESISPLQWDHPLQKSLEDTLPNPARRVFVTFKLPFAPEGLVPLTLGYLIHSGKHIIRIRQIRMLQFSYKLASGYMGFRP